MPPAPSVRLRLATSRIHPAITAITGPLPSTAATAPSKPAAAPACAAVWPASSVSDDPPSFRRGRLPDLHRRRHALSRIPPIPAVARRTRLQGGLKGDDALP